MQGFRQSVKGALDESTVFAHLIRGARDGDKVFKYRDAADREVDAVIINRESKTLRLIAVNSKGAIDPRTVFANEAKHLFNDAILSQISVGSAFAITRVIAHLGKNMIVAHQDQTLLLVNIERLLERYEDFGDFLDESLRPLS
jgi:translation initiation factor 6 (eIF-6)